MYLGVNICKNNSQGTNLFEDKNWSEKQNSYLQWKMQYFKTGFHLNQK